MTFTPLQLAAAWLIDLYAGDPPELARFHPVVWLGKLICAFEGLVYCDEDPDLFHFAKGVLLWLVVVGLAFFGSSVALAAARGVSPTLGAVLSVWLAWTTISTGDLIRQVSLVADLAKSGRTEAARKALGMIVGRDTAHLDEGEIYRAAFETCAENTSDGVVAPLFYLTLGALLGLGPALGVTYKAVNTLDSMVGYKNARYNHFGRFSAWMDDVANFIPSRLTAALAVLAARWAGEGAGRFDGARAWAIARRDHAKHSSPNAGWPEGAWAGAAGVRIGGRNSYGGIEKESPLIGDPVNPLDHRAVENALTLTRSVSAAAMLGGATLLTLAYLLAS